jgi:hypothetical protein
MNNNFSNYPENVITFECDYEENIYMGTPVKMSKSNTVAACRPGENMIGVAVNVRNGYAAVQLSGYIEMPTDEAFEVGYRNIIVAEDNKVRSNRLGREYLVTYVEKGIVGFIL